MANPPAIRRIFSTSHAAGRLTATINEALSDASAFQLLLEQFLPVHDLFNTQSGRHSLEALIHRLVEHSPARPYMIIDLSSSADHPWLGNDDVQARIIRLITEILRRTADKQWRDSGSRANCSVIFDAAHRFAGSGAGEGETAALARHLATEVRETRKVGIGWTFITEQIRSLHPQIFAQLIVKAFGYGLNTGTDLDTLREEVGSAGALEFYRSLSDPRSRASGRTYPFMITGPISPCRLPLRPLSRCINEFRGIHRRQRLP